MKGVELRSRGDPEPETRSPGKEGGGQPDFQEEVSRNKLEGTGVNGGFWREVTGG